MSATPLLLNVFIFQRINGIFFFDLMHCIDHGCKDHKKYAECCNKLLLLYSFTWHNRGYRNLACRIRGYRRYAHLRRARDRGGRT